MSEGTSTGTPVWVRDVDEAAAQRRWRRFGTWFAVPVAAIAIVALVLGGAWEMLGVLIVSGLFGGLLALGIFLLNRGLRANPEIRLIDGRLVLNAHTSVAVAEVEAWTTHVSKSVGSTGASGPAAMAIFRIPVVRDGQRGVRPDGGPAFDTVTFPWPEMSRHELDGVREALVPHLPAPWVILERLRD